MRLALIGFGEWVRTAYVPTLSTLSNVEVVGVAARSRATQEHARQLLGDTVRITGDYEDLLREDSVDAVMVAVPNLLHYEVALKAIESGKHLFLELPIALRLEDVEVVLEAAEPTDRVVQFDFELRYMPVAVAVKEKVRRGEVGRPVAAAVELTSNWGHRGGSFNEPTAREGFYLWLGAWYLDLLGLMLDGSAPRRVQVMGGRAMNGPMLDHGHALLEYENGTVGRFSHSVISTRPEPSVLGSLVGEEGELILNFEDGSLLQYSRDGASREESHPPKQPVFGWAGMRECIEHFVAAVIGGRPLKGEVQAARRIHQAVFACQEADQEDRLKSAGDHGPIRKAGDSSC